MRDRVSRGTSFGVVVRLGAVPVGADVAAVRRRYEEEFGESPEDRGGWYHADDWRRISFVLSALRPGGRFLDVGLGAGQFVNAVARSGRFGEVHGCDLYRFKKYIEFGGPISRATASVAELPYPDDHFDVVTCMEVLEHVPDEILDHGLSELRRVCRGQLLMSVPFEEPEPIYVGHQRRFLTADINRVFPRAERALLARPVTPWALLEEWCGPAEDATPGSAMLRAGIEQSSMFDPISVWVGALRWRSVSFIRARLPDRRQADS